MRHVLIGLPLLLITSACCNKQLQQVSSGSTTPEVAEVEIDSIYITGDTALYNLQGYRIASFLTENNSIYAYNRKTHAIDIINLDSNKIAESIQLDVDGPNSVNLQISGINAWSADTITLFDSQAICVLNKKGHIINKISLPDNYNCIIDANCRINIAGYDINFDTHTVTYPIFQQSPQLLIHDFNADSLLRRIELRKPMSNGKHGFMQAPNVSYNKNLVIYNYPFKSNIYIYDLNSDSTRTCNPHSNFVSDTMPPSGTEENFDDIEWYGFENFFHSPLYHIENKQQYVRFTLGPTPLARNQAKEKAMESRPLYAMFFDESFNPIGECKLPTERYNHFSCWHTMPESVAIFAENASQASDENVVIIDKIAFNPK